MPCRGGKGCCSHNHVPTALDGLTGSAIAGVARVIADSIETGWARGFVDRGIGGCDKTIPVARGIARMNRRRVCYAHHPSRRRPHRIGGVRGGGRACQRRIDEHS